MEKYKQSSIESTFKETPIQYLKSFLSINTHVGCNLGCEYCIIRAFNLPSYPKKIASPDKVFQKLTKNLYFIPNETPIAINNKTEPLLPSVKTSTFKLLTLFSRYELSNPIVIISKLSYTREEVKYLEKLDINLYHFTSYSGLGYPIEKIKPLVQEENIKLLSGTNIKSIHYWRPIIEGINDRYEKLEKILDFVANKCDASVVSGIRLPRKVLENFKRLNINLKFNEHYVEHKKLKEETKRNILEISQIKYPDYPIFFHTSCVLSYFENKPDYQVNYLREGLHCNPFCKNKESCTKYLPSNDFVRKEISKFTEQYKIIWKEKRVLVPKTLSLEDISHLMYRVRLKVERKLME